VSVVRTEPQRDRPGELRRIAPDDLAGLREQTEASLVAPIELTLRLLDQLGRTGDGAVVNVTSASLYVPLASSWPRSLDWSVQPIERLSRRPW
jgi:hypothetical protein